MSLHSLKQWFSKYEEHYPQLSNEIKGHYIDGALYQDFYKTFDGVHDKKYDGLIITGAPIEHLLFEEVDYLRLIVVFLFFRGHFLFQTFLETIALQNYVFAKIVDKVKVK